MKDYKRLTDKKNLNKPKCYNCEYNYLNCSICKRHCVDDNYFQIREELQRLCDLEDKIENGTLIELPCKVGDTVYEANTKNYQVYCHTVYKIQLRECLIVYWTDGKGSKDYGYFGKDIFLTKTEAEAKLKGLQNEMS